VEEAASAIKAMLVRGAPLIGATAAYGMCLAVHENPSDNSIKQAGDLLINTRPTAVNLRWAIEAMKNKLLAISPEAREATAYSYAETLCEEDVEINRSIGENGLKLIQEIATSKDNTVEILTHCNAGWLATVDYGTALAPIYKAHDAGIPVHVWVDETRPRNQGASLTAWELAQHGVPHTVIVDNAGGHLMQMRQVDLCLVGTDRTTSEGDVCNKIGTYLKALAAHDNNIPFYVALPYPTIDWSIRNGITEIPIEVREESEVTHITGCTAEGILQTIRLTPENSPTANYAFDITPARLITGLITERGICPASREGLLKLYPERTSVLTIEAESRPLHDHRNWN
jgi:methylthioribose-1-phosphate isomerase